MNKKIMILIVAIIVLAGGVFFWQYSKQNTAKQPLSENNNSSVCASSTCNETTKVEKNLVEIFYLPHAPAKAIVDKVDKILQKFSEYKVEKYDFYNESNKQKITDYNLLGHIPVAIFIGGVNSFTIDGQKITFKNFPKGDAFVPTLEGSWSYDDLEKVLANPDKYQDD